MNQLLSIVALASAAALCGCIGPGPAPEEPRPPIVGGPCSYDNNAGTVTVSRVVDGEVYFQYTPGGDGKADSLDADLRDRFDSDVPAVGQVFPAVRSLEIKGTCVPFEYRYRIGGKERQLAPAPGVRALLGLAQAAANG